jgi:hypothetical protein
MSSITGTVNIPRNSILMLDSVESPQIHGNCQIFTKVKNKAELLTDDQYKDIFGKPFTHKNILWDGQALLDKSIFEKAGYTGDNKHGMMLLRNSFFKACAFNTNIQKYYKDNHVKEVTDMFGNKLKAKDIRMIVTIDSFKMDKFAPVFYQQIKKINDEKPSDNANDLEKRKTIYKYWLEHIDEKFGIVKEEKPSHLGHGKYHEISYQILNTLPLSKDDIIKITKDDREYIERLRSDTDFSVFLYHIRTNDQSLRKKFFIYNMLRHCPDFENTTYFKKFRLDEINQYKENMRKGRLKLRGDFYVLCSMPMEMLEYSVHRDVGQIHPYLSKNTAYIHGIKAEEDIPLFRYPHMNSGSVCVLKTQDCTEYDRYFNLDHNTGSNIIVLSPWESNVMAKLGGADFDSDTALYIKDPIILSAAKKLAEFEWMNSNDEGPSIALTDKILKGDPKTYSYDPIGFASLDTSLAKSAIEIGSLSNDAQLFNSYLWEGYKSGKDTKYLHLIYNCILKLAALNELEIDRAKHSIGIPISAIHDEIKKVKFNGNPVIEKTNSDNESKDKTYIPFFMYDTKNPQKNRYKALREGKLKLWNCPVDYISMVLKEEPGLSRTKKQSINDLSLLFELKGDKPNEGQLKVFRDEISELLEEIDSIDRDRNLDDSERAEKKKQRYDEYLNSICKKKITLATMRRLFQYAFDKYKCDAKDGSYKKNDYKYPKLANNKNKFRYLGLLFDIGEIYFEKKKTCTNLAIECIKNNTQKDIKVIKYAPFCDHPDVILWGDPYSVKVE